MASSPLLALPAELVDWIVEFLPIEDLPSTAATCRKMLGHLENRLQRYRNYRTAYRIQHDRMPSTIPKLLRIALSNPEAAWHIRTLDFWGARYVLEDGHSNWNTWASTEEVEKPEWPEPDEDFTDEITTFFDEGELLACETMLRNTFQLSEEAAERWVRQLRECYNDEPMKAVLAALLPNIQSVNYIGYRNWAGNPSSEPLSLIGEAIVNIYDSPARAWPPGFASLRRVDVASFTGLRDSSFGYGCDQEEVIALFLLPNLKVLNITDVMGERNATSGFEVPAGSSSIEELGLYGCEIDGWHLKQFLRAPKRLLKLSLDADDDARWVGQCVADRHAASLEEMNVEAVKLLQLRDFTNLKVCISLFADEVVEKGLPRQFHGTRHSHGNALYWVAESGNMCLLDLRELLSPTIEKLMLRPTVGLGWSYSSQALEQLFTMLADLVEDPRFTGLTQICIFGLKETWIFKDEIEDVLADSAYRRAVDRLKGRGVELHDWCSSEEHKKLHPTLTGLGHIETDPLNSCTDLYMW